MRLLETGDDGSQKRELLLQHKADPHKASSHAAHDMVHPVALFEGLTDSSR